MHGKMKNLALINHPTVIYNTSSNSETIEIRKVQALTGERSFTLVFAKHFALELGVGRGDFLKFQVDGNRLIVEKMNP
jgi:hypothetical protein